MIHRIIPSSERQLDISSVRLDSELLARLSAILPEFLPTFVAVDTRKRRVVKAIKDLGD